MKHLNKDRQEKVTGGDLTLILFLAMNCGIAEVEVHRGAAHTIARSC